MESISISLYIICHDDDSERAATALMQSHYPYARIVRIEAENKYFENQIFTYLRNNSDEWAHTDYCGIITYSILQKIGKPVDIHEAIKTNPGGDIYTLYNLQFVKKKLNLPISFLEGVTIQHGPFFFQTLMTILKRHGFREADIMDKNVPGFFCNYWIAKSAWMMRYIQFFLNTKRMIEHDATLNTYIHEHSWYTGNLSKERLIQISGRPYYTMHPFLFERLPCFYFHLNRANIIPIGAQGYYMLMD
jgi:hypothetical protein